MLKRSLRLRKNSQFKKVYTLGKGYSNRWLVLRLIRLDHLKITQIGFSVSKKLGGAVIRNRIKRQMSAAVRQYAEHLIAGYYVVFIAKNNIKSASFEQIQSAAFQLIKQARLL